MDKKNNHLTPYLIQAFLDQELNPQELRFAQEHSMSCRTCQEEIEKQKRLISRLEQMTDLSFEKDLSGEILSQIKDQQHNLSGITWTLVIEALAAGAVIGALIPVFQAASWMTELINTRQEVLAAINIFFTQLASTWIVWWAQLQLDIKGLFDPINSTTRLLSNLPSPWIMIVTAGFIGVFINYLLLRNNPVQTTNHQS